MYTRITLFLFLFLNAEALFANKWTGAYHTSILKQSALKNEKSNTLASIEQYLELASFYIMVNKDSTKFFTNKALSVALLSNDNNLITVAWLKQWEYLPYNNTAIANAKQAITSNANPMLKCMLELTENDKSQTLEMLEKADKLLLASYKTISKASEFDQLLFILLLEKRAAKGFIVNTKKYPYDIDIALNIAKRKQYMKVYMTLLFYKSMVFDNNANFDKALKASQKYEEEAKNLDNIVYYQLALANISGSAYYAGKIDLAEAKCLELINFNKTQINQDKALSNNKLTEAYNRLFMIYSDQNKFDKALYYVQKCIQVGDSLGKLGNAQDSSMAVNASINLGILYSKMDDYRKAVNQFLEVFRKYDIEQDYVTLNNLNNNLGDSYLKLGEYQKALYYINLCQTDINQLDILSQYYFYQSKRDAFVGLNQMDSAYFYYQYLTAASDSLFNIEKQDAIAEASEKYKTDVLKAENKTLTVEKEASKAKEWLYRSAIGFGIVLGMVGFNSFRNQRKLKLKQEALFIAEKENLANQLIAKEAKEAQYELDLQLKEAKEQEILSRLEFKSRETTSMASVALQNANLLVEIQGIIKGINGNQEENNRIMREVNTLIGNQKHLEAFWDTFRRYFQEIHPRFFDILEEQHSSLTLNDQKICAYLVLGMTTIEISLLQNIETRSFLRYRQRLKEKLGLETSEEIEIYLKSLG